MPQEVRDLYGKEYFSKYITCVSGTACDRQSQDDSETTPLISESKSSAKKDPSNGLSQRKNQSHKTKSLGKSDLEEEDLAKRRSFSTLSSSASSTLKSNGQVNLTNMNRVLHALVEAATSPSPKVRYFVGSFHDRMVKALSPMLPTVFVDHYFTSGDVANVVPRKIKEKME